MSRLPVKLDDLLDAFDHVSGGGNFSENEAYLCLATGAFHFRTDADDFGESLPDDVADEEKYLPIPHKNDLDLGRQLVLDFTGEFMPDALDRVYDIFRRKGAYARFSNLLERRNLLPSWYDYRDRREREAVRQWCAANGIAISD